MLTGELRNQVDRGRAVVRARTRGAAGAGRGAAVRTWLAAGSLLLAGACLAGCGVGTGVVPVGQGVYAAAEMRAPVRGGGAEAQRAVLAEAGGFCQQQGRRLAVLTLRPGGDPRIREWPTAFDLTFMCV